MYYIGDTMAIEVVLRKVGNSLGIIFPKDMVKDRQLKPNQKIFIEVVKEADIRDIFGTLKTNLSGQAFKNMVRERWE